MDYAHDLPIPFVLAERLVDALRHDGCRLWHSRFCWDQLEHAIAAELATLNARILTLRGDPMTRVPGERFANGTFYDCSPRIL